MKLSDFNYELPPHLIAQFPLEKRSASRLLCLNAQTGELTHNEFHQLIDLIDEKDLLVFNNTKVMPARFFGQKETGGKVEFLLERLLNPHEALVMLKASKTPKPGAVVFLDDRSVIKVIARQNDFFHIKLLGEKDFISVMNQIGEMPLPPYMHRAAELSDQSRYQTVYAKHLGAVAAPTAGLHFDETLLNRLKEKNIASVQLTLHVGAGTFMPVRVDDITQHQMHKEFVEVSDEVVDAVKACKNRGGRVIAVGTTSVRSLETAALQGSLETFRGDSQIFIYPGFKFNVADAMITNFHLPQSTLLMLVSAFASKDFIFNAYQTAIENEYRFFSYGDAMFIYRD